MRWPTLATLLPSLGALVVVWIWIRNRRGRRKS